MEEETRDDPQSTEEITVYVCSICQALFQSNKAVALHMLNMHKNEMKIQSLLNGNRIGKKLPKRSPRIRRYNSIHECTYCSYQTVHQTSLKRHLLTHQKHYKRSRCPYCPYSAIQVSNLKRHVLCQHQAQLP